jgi:hypothetical protein
LRDDHGLVRISAARCLRYWFELFSLPELPSV